jgi:predicted ATPase/class 3 adenylate cyclase
MSNLPDGTLTFLFTDIEGSTRLWEQETEAMQQARNRHLEIIRGCIQEYGGSFVRERMEGDATFSVFTNAADAVAAVCGFQRSLYAEAWPTQKPIRVRAALHTGVARLEDEDYNSSDVNRCARLRAIAHGGQTVLSQTTCNLARDYLPPDVSLRDMGEHRLKDLLRPEQVYQLLHPELPLDFPPLVSLDNLPTNLPVQLSSFIGREAEMAEVRRRLSETRLLTLTGVGGIGKTRLALQATAELLGEDQDTVPFPGGVWFVELASVTGPAQVPSAVAAALGVREQAGRPIVETLKDYLKPKTLLLVLDCCEHLIAPCASLANVLLREAPNLRLLATSREALGVAGEAIWNVPSLTVPEPNETASLDTAARSEAVRLFVERAKAVKPAFSLPDGATEVVAAICWRLGGIPLAIELAAVKAKYLTVQELYQELDDLFRLLTGGDRTALPRQQTLEAMIEWSDRLLLTDERLLWWRLSVFAGGWTLEAAREVCSGNGMREQDIRELLFRLIDKCLVVSEQRGEATRYRLLEIMRQYTQNKLVESGEGEGYRKRHLDYCLRLAEEAERQLRAREQLAWLNRLETEHDNLRAALRWSQARPENGEAGTRLAGALCRFWLERGYLTEGRQSLEARLGSAPALPDDARAKLQHAAGTLSMELGDHSAAQTLLEESLRTRRRLDDRPGLASTLVSLGALDFAQTRLQEARARFEESLAFRRETADRYGEADTLMWLGNVAYSEEQFRAAYDHYRDALTLYRELEVPLGLVKALLNLASVVHEMGELTKARPLYEECLKMARKLQLKLIVAHTLNNLGNLARQQRDNASARACLLEALALYRQLANKYGIAGCLCNLVAVADYPGDWEEARTRLAESLKLYRELNNPAGIATVLESFACLAVMAGQAERAASLLGAAAALRTGAGVVREPVDEAIYAAAVTGAQRLLDAAAYEQAWHVGLAMTCEQAVDYALAIRMPVEPDLLAGEDLFRIEDYLSPDRSPDADAISR